MTQRIVIVGACSASLRIGLLLDELQRHGGEVVLADPGELQARKPSRLGELLSGELQIVQPPAPTIARRRGEKAQWKRERTGRPKC